MNVRDVFWYLSEGQSRRAGDGIPLGFVMGVLFTIGALYVTGNMP